MELRTGKTLKLYQLRITPDSKITENMPMQSHAFVAFLLLYKLYAVNLQLRMSKKSYY